MADATAFLDLLRDSLGEIGSDYYGRDYFSDETLRDLGIDIADPRLPALRSHLRRFGERVFCYQLYHRLQVRLEEIEFRDGGPILQGELKKSEIHAILDLIPDDVKPLNKEFVPDFLYHSPVNFDHQEVVIEVKANPEVGFPDLREDLHKLSQFTVRYHYWVGILLIVNNDPSRIRKLFEANLDQLRDVELPEKIRVLVQEGADTDLWEANLAELVA